MEFDEIFPVFILGLIAGLLIGVLIGFSTTDELNNGCITYNDDVYCKEVSND